ncbi:MAG: hypothetical protein DRJ49_03560 [Thermoprotei archaeon]|nr:MAG: hypothetical protein DRJ49_03560 [Thermoprotei archaeon]
MIRYTVRDIMTHRVITVRPKDTLLDAHKLLQRHGIARVVVVDEEYRPIGIMTRKDIIEFLMGDISGRALDDIEVEEVMKSNPVCVRESYSIPEAARLMLKKGISSLPIIDSNGKLIGIVTKTDMCRFYTNLRGLNKVRDYMSSPVITVRPYDSVFKAALLMMNMNISRLVVAVGREIRGVLTLSDLMLVVPLLKGPKEMPRRVLRALLTRGVCCVADIMTSDPITVHETEDLATAARLMILHRISGLPVLNEENLLSGILTKTDITRAVADIKLK